MRRSRSHARVQVSDAIVCRRWIGFDHLKSNLKIMVLMDASLRYRELKIFLLVGKYNRETHPR